MEGKYGTSARISKPALAVALNPFKPIITPAAYARAPLGLFFFIFDRGRGYTQLDVNIESAAFEVSLSESAV